MTIMLLQPNTLSETVSLKLSFSVSCPFLHWPLCSHSFFHCLSISPFSFLSFSAVPPYIRSRGLSRLLTFLWLPTYYVGTIRFILTRFTSATLTTLLSAFVCLCACMCFMDMTLLRVNDVWEQTEEFRLLKFP